MRFKMTASVSPASESGARKIALGRFKRQCRERQVPGVGC